MQALTDFLTTDYGLMSLAGLLFMFGMLGYIAWYVAQACQARHRAPRQRSARRARPLICAFRAHKKGR
jgi:hypothetical protein